MHIVAITLMEFVCVIVWDNNEGGEENFAKVGCLLVVWLEMEWES
jgi:hypothetical protein